MRPVFRSSLAVAALVPAVLGIAVATGVSPSAAAVHTSHGGDPFSRSRLYTSPYTSAATASVASPSAVRRKLAILVRTPQAQWFGDWQSPTAVRGSVHGYVQDARRASSEPVLVTYAIPHRDCGSYSAGGLHTGAAYRTWVRGVAAGIGSAPAAVIVEPDAIASSTCLTRMQQQQRYALLRYEVRALTRHPHTDVYLDGGNSAWLPPAVLAARLRRAGVARARGFSLNVSGFYATSTEDRYGEHVSALVHGKHYVIDTSRNGRGAAPAGPLSWCNPPGRGLGVRPTSRTGARHADAYLWIKHPGESDGACRNGAPAAGQWYQSYALGLIARRA